MENQNKITCNACNCLHNDGHMHCKATEVKVGTQSACTCDETRCATFEMKDGHNCNCK